MAEPEEELSDVFEQLVDNVVNKQNYYAIKGKATNIDEAKRTCDLEPFNEMAKRTNIRLQSVVSETLGFVLIPKLNSTIVVSFFDSKKGYVTLTSELEKILIDTNLTQFNGGALGGLIKINDLVTNIQKIETTLEALIVTFNAHIHITTATDPLLIPGVISPPAPPAVALGQVTTVPFLEDTKVTH